MKPLLTLLFKIEGYQIAYFSGMLSAVILWAVAEVIGVSVVPALHFLGAIARTGIQ